MDPRPSSFCINLHFGLVLLLVGRGDTYHEEPLTCVGPEVGTRVGGYGVSQGMFSFRVSLTDNRIYTLVVCLLDSLII